MSQKLVILFASPHCVIDFTSGAALATMDTLQVLARDGFNCRAFCASKLDGDESVSFDQLVADLQVPVQIQELNVDEKSVRLLSVTSGSVPVWIFRTQSGQINLWAPHEPLAMLGAFDRILSSVRPDVLLTYGGHPVASSMMQLARERRVPVFFALHNLAYDNVDAFKNVDHVFVPSDFSRRYYRERLGLECHVLPNAIDWDRVGVGDWGLGVGGGTRADQEPNSSSSPQSSSPIPSHYLTFVNPQPAKGLFVFAQIAEQIARRRPDIPILVVESRGQASWLEQTNLDLSWAENLHAMENTPDPRDYYRVTKLLLMPSLVPESFGLVAAEAMINGIPVLASNRGALPETLGARDWGLGKSDWA